MTDNLEDIQNLAEEAETTEIAEAETQEIAPLSRLRQELAIATETRDIARIQQVIGAAAVAAEMQHRVARIAEQKGTPIEVVTAANEAANEASAVKLMAQSEAGHIIQELREQGFFPDRKERGRKGGLAKAGKSTDETGYEVLGVPRQSAWMWEKVANIGDTTLATYLSEIKAEGGEVTTKGLLRYAAPPKEEPDGELGLAQVYNEVMKALTVLIRFRDAGAIAAYAVDNRRKGKFSEAISVADAWIEEAKQTLA